MRGERQLLLLAQQIALQQQIRHVESEHKAIHDVLLNWGRWGRNRIEEMGGRRVVIFPGSPGMSRPAIWGMGKPDEADRDPDAIPEKKPPKIDSLGAELVDARINECDAHERTFSALWAKILFVNYVWRPVEWERPACVRFRRGRHLGAQSYLDQLEAALEGLE